MESLCSPIPNHENPSPPSCSSPNLQGAIVLQSVNTWYAKGISLSSLAPPPAFGKLHVICCHSVAKPGPTLWDPMAQSAPGFPVLHYLPELAQTHVHQVDDAIHSSHPLSPPSPPALNLSQHQGLFQWLGSSHQMAKVMSLLFNMLSRCAIAFQGVGIFSFHGCSHHLQWFGGPRK